MLLRRVVVEVNGVGPGEVALNSNREVIVEDFFDVGIVMTNRGYAAEKIADSAPPQAHVFGNGTMLAEGRGVGTMNVIGPLDEVAVSAFAKAGEQCKFQMIVGVHKAREYQETAEIEAAFAGFRAMK